MHVVGSGFSARSNKDVGGVQIDLLLDRADDAINLVEAKFSPEPFIVTKAYAKTLHDKVARFRLHTGTRKQLFVLLVAPYGLRQNEHSLGLIHAVVSVDNLFLPEN